MSDVAAGLLLVLLITILGMSIYMVLMLGYIRETVNEIDRVQRKQVLGCLIWLQNETTKNEMTVNHLHDLLTGKAIQ